jgi:hypothetical protein
MMKFFRQALDQKSKDIVAMKFGASPFLRGKCAHLRDVGVLVPLPLGVQCPPDLCVPTRQRVE